MNTPAQQHRGHQLRRRRGMAEIKPAMLVAASWLWIPVLINIQLGPERRPFHILKI